MRLKGREQPCDTDRLAKHSWDGERAGKAISSAVASNPFRQRKIAV
jgi:hypothetical protein